jgi:hypothetical protein
MSRSKLVSSGCSLLSWVAVFCVATMITSPARAAFHLWSLNELYTNSSGTLQFIELTDPTFGGNQFVNASTMSVSNIGNTMTNMFTFTHNLPNNTMPINSLNHKFLIGTAGIQAAGGPAPDFIVPDGFLFQAGGSISYFNASGSYTALPTDGTMSRIWGGSTNNAVNSPTNFAGQTGVVMAAPEPASMVLATLAFGSMFCASRRRKAKSSAAAT